MIRRMAGFDDPGFAPAKVNLFLHITGRRADGYHLLESLVVFPRFGDRLTLISNSANDGPSLTLSGPFADALGLAGGPQNLVLQAALAFAKRLGRERDLPSLHFYLEKMIPVAAGLGGGSADAAAALRLLANHWRIAFEDPVLHELAAKLGADVPMCLNSSTQLISGIGEIVKPAPKFPGDLAILIANPGVAIPTAEVFHQLDSKVFSTSGAINEIPAHFERTADFFQILEAYGNDLTPAAIALAPSIADLLAALQALPKSRCVSMSGSGASCFALFEGSSAAEYAAELLKEQRSGDWIVTGSIDDVSQ